MNKQKGFTLIELVVVIVILGILAVTAAPRFLNLQSDARASALQGLKGAMAGAGSIVYGKSAIEGIETISAARTLTDTDIEVKYGYPTASTDGIGNAVEGLNDESEWKKAADPLPGPNNETGISYTFTNNGNDECIVTYYESFEGAAPVISAATATDC